MSLTLQQYAEFLQTRELTWPIPPERKKPKAKPHLEPLDDLRAITWSVYGTLVRISFGELLLEHPQEFVMDVALDKTLQEFNMWGSMTRKPGRPAEMLGRMYAKELEKQRTAPSPGEAHPEVRAEVIWEGILQKLLQKEYSYDVGFYGDLSELSAKVALFFHAGLQGTACYPGASLALRSIAAAGVRQGLVDNGQVFSIAQLGQLLIDEENLPLPSVVDAGLCLFSYQVGARKPSPRMFRDLLSSLEVHGILPQQLLHVGSSVERDVIPARQLGIRTALFAGDKESLDARAGQLKDPASRPDLLLTELEQISQVLPIQ